MNKLFKIIFEYVVLFFVYGIIYFIIETIYKGRATDYRMFILGGLIGCSIGLLNNIFTYDTDILLQGLVGAIIVTLSEAILGYQWNIIEGLKIWDYTNLPCSAIDGQVNLFFFIAWFFLSIVCVILDDVINRYIFKSNEQPYYKLFGKTIIKLK